MPKFTIGLLATRPVSRNPGDLSESPCLDGDGVFPLVTSPCKNSPLPGDKLNLELSSSRPCCLPRGKQHYLPVTGAGP